MFLIKTCLAAILFTAVNAVPDVAELNGYGHHRLVKRDEVTIFVNNPSWTLFEFGAAGSRVNDSYVFSLSNTGIVKVTDAFCTGDSFAVFDSGKLLGFTNPVPTDNCVSSTQDPDVAWQNQAFSHGSWTLLPGHHNITLYVVDSPFGAGGSFLRVDTVAMKCITEKHELFIVNTPVVFADAEDTCKKFGNAKLADIDIFNFLSGTEIAFSCAGPFSQSWVKSYFGNNYLGSCLVLSTGNAAPGGSVNVPETCRLQLPVMCQRLLLEDDRHKEGDREHHEHHEHHERHERHEHREHLEHHDDHKSDDDKEHRKQESRKGHHQHWSDQGQRRQG